MIKNVARDVNEFPVCWGNLLFLTIGSGLCATGVVVAAARLVLPLTIPEIVIISVCLAELLCSRLTDCSAMAFQAIESLDRTAQLTIGIALARLIGIAGLAAIVRYPSIQNWAIVYLSTSILAATLGVIWVNNNIGQPRLELRRVKGELSEGFYFAASLSAQNIYNDIDKSMLARMATLDAVGVYAAAYRLIDVAFIPVRSILNAAYPGFFRAGQTSICGALGYMWRLLPQSAGYSLIASLLIVFGAALVPHFLGTQYARTVEALRWLAVLPFLKTVHYFTADVLTCSGHQRCRTLIQAVMAGFNVMVNLSVIPLYSWRGAAWSSVATDAALAGSMLSAILFLRTRSKLAGDPEMTPVNLGHSLATAATAKRRRYVIVNADDFGASRDTNRAILLAFEMKLISSATIMTNMPGFDHACELARRHQIHHKIGLHLNLTLGKPLSADIARLPKFCDSAGNWLPPRRILALNRGERLALEVEIAAQIMACRRQGIEPTHLDSHHHIHTELGIAPVVVRVAKRFGIRTVRIGRNCGPFRTGSSAAHKAVAGIFRKARNVYWRLRCVAMTKYFGDSRDTAHVLRTTNADVEVMVHPKFNDIGKVVDLHGQDLQSVFDSLDINRCELCDYRDLALKKRASPPFPVFNGFTNAQ